MAQYLSQLGRLHPASSVVCTGMAEEASCFPEFSCSHCITSTSCLVFLLILSAWPISILLKYMIDRIQTILLHQAGASPWLLPYSSYPIPGCPQAPLSICRVIGFPNSASCGAEGLGTKWWGQLLQNFLYPTEPATSVWALLSARSLASEGPGSCTRRFILLEGWESICHSLKLSAHSGGASLGCCLTVLIPSQLAPQAPLSIYEVIVSCECL